MQTFVYVILWMLLGLAVLAIGGLLLIIIIPIVIGAFAYYGIKIIWITLTFDDGKSDVQPRKRNTDLR